MGRCPMTVTSGMVRCQADFFLLSVCCAKSAAGRQTAKANNRYSLFILPPFLFPAERTNWYLKLIFLLCIGIGTYLMTDIKNAEKNEKRTWFIFALLSAIFAAATSLLASIGIQNVDSNLGTAIRTIVVFILAWVIVFFKKEIHFIQNINQKEVLFLILSGVATGASWLCYYFAIQQGQISVVVPIDRLSILVTVLFSYFVFHEKLSMKSFIGLLLLIVGTVCMAIFT